MMKATGSRRDIGTVPEGTGDGEERLLLEVSGLRKSFGGQVVLDGIDLELREGEVILLRGENGSGKTTLLNILTGNMEPDAGEIHFLVNSRPEHFRFPRRWWQELNPWDHFTPERVAREGIGRTWQDTRLFGSQTLAGNLAVAHPGQPGERPWRVLSRPRLWPQAETRNQEAAQALLDSLGLGDRADSSADMISLGQMKRVAFGRCVRAETKVVFLDEPLAGLDREGMESILSVLRELSEVHGLTLVIVEHVFNIPMILDFATAVWTLAQGRITRETIAEARADPSVHAGTPLPDLLEEIAGPDTIITEEPLPRGALLTRVSRRGAPREPLLTVRGVVARRGHRLVVGEQEDEGVVGFDLTVHPGDLVFIQAPNGWGKTSLLETLAGILPCEGGTIELDGRRLEREAPWERRLSGLAVVPARENVFNNLTVAEFRHICAGSTGQSADGGGGLRSNPCPSGPRMISSLSGGERKRLVLESAEAQPAMVRVWDEPFSSLDAHGSRAVAQLLQSDSQQGCVVLLPRELDMV